MGELWPRFKTFVKLLDYFMEYRKIIKEDRGGRRRGEAGRNGSDEDGDTGDNMSVVSSASETHSIALDGAEDEIDETSAQENFEDKVKDVIDGTTQKSAKGRTESLLGLKAAMSKK